MIEEIKNSTPDKLVYAPNYPSILDNIHLNHHVAKNELEVEYYEKSETERSILSDIILTREIVEKNLELNITGIEYIPENTKSARKI